jgi:hypothetical protein
VWRRLVSSPTARGQAACHRPTAQLEPPDYAARG